MGLRQLRHPVQGVRQRRAPRAPSRRRSPTPPTVHRFTGLAPTVALHIPWDLVDDFGALARVRRGPRRRARARSTPTPSRTTTTSSAASPTPTRRSARKAIDHNLDCIEVMNETGSRDLKIWLADGTNYPGQGDIRGPPGLAGRGPRATIYDQLGDDQRLVLEYKFFEPAFYHTDVPDWGTSYAHVRGPRRRARWSASTPATTRRAPTSSSSSPSCCGSGSSARSTSTAASTPTTT